MEEIEIKDPKAVLDALERAKADAKKYREKAEALEAEKETLNTRITELEADETVSKYKQRIMEMLAKSELSKQGIKDADRVYGLLEKDKITLDDEDNLTGLDEALTGLKTKIPELFNTKKRVGGAADLFEKEPVEKKLTSTEMQVQKIFSNH